MHAEWEDVLNRKHTMTSSPQDTEEEFLRELFRGIGPRYPLVLNGTQGHLTGGKKITFVAEQPKPIIKNFADADRFVEKLLTGTAEEFRVPVDDARRMGGLLKDLLAEVRK